MSSLWFRSLVFVRSCECVYAWIAAFVCVILPVDCGSGRRHEFKRDASEEKGEGS